jgi:hypothetical protein
VFQEPAVDAWVDGALDLRAESDQESFASAGLDHDHPSCELRRMTGSGLVVVIKEHRDCPALRGGLKRLSWHWPGVDYLHLISTSSNSHPVCLFRKSCITNASLCCLTGPDHDVDDHDNDPIFRNLYLTCTYAEAILGAGWLFVVQQTGLQFFPPNVMSEVPEGV